jgi:type I restriction enzyme S subunit
LVETGDDWIASTGLAVLTPLSVSSAYLFETVSSRAFSDYLVSQEGGAAYPAVKPKDFEAAPIVVPDTDTDHRFEDAVAPQQRTVWKLREQARYLASLRDLLLPRLVTGKIDVSCLELDSLLEAAG